MNFMVRPDFSKLDKADPESLLQAVAIVNAEYERDGKQPGAERWQSDTRRYRKQMIDDVFHEWSTIAKTDEVFPWHDDYVAEVWVTFRKLDTGSRIAMWEHFGIEVPQRLIKREKV